jgi:hypothetical protein
MHLYSLDYPELLQFFDYRFGRHALIDEIQKALGASLGELPSSLREVLATATSSLASWDCARTVLDNARNTSRQQSARETAC